ncbi:MAG: hypothetical protein ACMUJM_00215 [bacterium]
MESNFDKLELESLERVLAKMAKTYNKKVNLHSHTGQDCIDEGSLQNYIERKESFEEADIIKFEEHLGRCDECFNRLMILEEMLHEPLINAPSPLKERVKNLVLPKKANILDLVLSFTADAIRVLRNTGNFAIPELGLQPVRGGLSSGVERLGDFIKLSKQIENIGVNLQLERIDDSLKLMIHTLDLKTHESPAGVRLMLFSNDRELNSVEESEAVFYVKFKNYFVKIYLHGKQIGIIQLRLKKEY